MAKPILSKLTEVIARVHNGHILELQLNTPKNLNAFGATKYWELIDGLNYARDNDHIKAVVVTSTGRFFSAGAAVAPGGMGGIPGAKGGNAAQEYVDALIDFPKLAICALQGPAYGITVTTLPLFDLVYGSPEVTLTTPFSRLGIALEGCSSVTFTPIFGSSMTSRLLYLAETIPIADLGYTGLFAGVLPQAGLGDAVITKVEQLLSDLTIGSIIASKSMLRTPEERNKLHRINAEEMRVVAERRAHPDHVEAIERFQRNREAAKKAKSKL